MKTPSQKRPAARFLNSVCFAALLVPALTGSAQSQTFSNRAAWDAYVAATPTDIDFTTRDDGSLITNPSNDIGISPLSLRCVDFLSVRSYWNASIYVFPAQVLRVNLPAGTYAFGTDLIPFYGLVGTGTILLSTGESFVYNPGFVPWTWDFFGVYSHTEHFLGGIQVRQRLPGPGQFLVPAGCLHARPAVSDQYQHDDRHQTGFLDQSGEPQEQRDAPGRRVRVTRPRYVPD